MKLRRASTLFLILALICGVVLAIDIPTQLFGRLLNLVHPCAQDLTASAPCFLDYDGQFAIVLLIMIVLGGLASLTCLAIFDLKQKLRRRKRS